MAITSVRIYYYPLTRERELKLNASHWGFAEWFERRLKPMREQLRGEEAKGVNIVNLMLHENPEHVGSPGEWRRVDNTFEFEHLCDLRPLERQAAIENLPKLMHFYAAVARQSPWPQVRALCEPLLAPLTDVDRLTILPYLQWPRGQPLTDAAARKLLGKGEAPNPSIEGTASSGLRPPPAAPDVKR